MALNNYNPLTALSAYFTSRAEKRLARLWATEKLLHDMAALGMVSFFEGSGSDPTGLDGYHSGKVWLQVSAGVTDTPGVVRAYDGSGDPTLLTSWPVLATDGFARFLGPQSMDNMVEGANAKIMTAAERARLAALAAAVVLIGTWDASSGTFPGGGTAQAGHSYIVSGDGTVDGVTFTAGDRIIAIANNASTTTFAANWFKADYTDQVSSVAGKTGVVLLVQADVGGLGTGDSPQLAGLNLGHASDTTLARDSAGWVAVEGNVLARRAPVGSSFSTGFTLAAADAGCVRWSNGTGAVTVLIPTNTAVPFPLGTVINLIQRGNGGSIIADGDTGVTVNGVSGGSVTCSTRWQGLTLVKVATDEWIVSGAAD